MFLKGTYSVRKEKNRIFLKLVINKLMHILIKNFCISLNNIWRTCRYFFIRKKNYDSSVYFTMALEKKSVSPKKKEKKKRYEFSLWVTGNLLWHYLFQKTDCAISRKVGHRVIVSCFGQRNMIYKFFINI